MVVGGLFDVRKVEDELKTLKAGEGATEAGGVGVKYHFWWAWPQR